MTSSPEARVLRGADTGAVRPLATPELRTGSWTRLGTGSVRGDAATEETLAVLADKTRDAARAEGYAVGWAQGRRAAAAAAEVARVAALHATQLAEQQRLVEHTAAVTALRAAAVALEEQTTTVCRGLTDQASDIAFAVTEQVLGHAAAAQLDTDVVRRVLEVLPDGVVSVVRLHPAVARGEAVHRLPASVSVVADPRLDRADALVELLESVVDLRVDRALARVREALR